jgi:hypothetical protein
LQPTAIKLLSINSSTPIGNEKKYLIEVFSNSIRRENYRINFSATLIR